MFSPCQKGSPRLSSLRSVAMEDLCLVWKQNVRILVFGCQIFRSDFKSAKWWLYGFREPWLLCVAIKVMDAFSILTTERKLE